MSRSKKIFRWVALLFLLALLYMAYDIGSRTVFPFSRVPSEEAKKTP